MINFTLRASNSFYVSHLVIITYFVYIVRNIKCRISLLDSLEPSVFRSLTISNTSSEVIHLPPFSVCHFIHIHLSKTYTNLVKNVQTHVYIFYDIPSTIATFYSICLFS